MLTRGIVCTLAALLPAIADHAAAQVATFNFAAVNQSYSAFLPPDDALVGQQIVSARIYLNVESLPGSDAANFYTDIAFPIDPLPSNTNALVLTGADLGWIGSGTFNYFLQTTEFNGVFVSAALRRGVAGGHVLRLNPARIADRVRLHPRTGDGGDAGGGAAAGETTVGIANCE
ncbi:MAG: hypothetical protein U1D55_17190 [Phycisphaerae bacterium]